MNLQAGESDRLLALHLHEAVQRLGSAALGVVDLPSLSEGELVPAQIRVGAVLAWCRHIEEGGLLLTVEHLAHRFRQGDTVATGPAAERLFRFGRERQDRFTADEREARYLAVFDATYDEAFGRLVGALDDAARDPYGVGRQHPAAIGVVAEEVARIVSNRCVGITGFFAREVVSDLRAAWALLRDPEIQGLFLVRSAWDLVRRVAPELGRPLVSPERANARADATRTILSWLADRSGTLNSGSLVPDPNALRAATTWRQVQP